MDLLARNKAWRVEMRAESRFCESWNQMHKIAESSAESNIIFAESSAESNANFAESTNKKGY